MRWLLVFTLLFIFSCSHYKEMALPKRHSGVGGSVFYKEAAAMQWRQRDSFAVAEAMNGNIPSFLGKFVPVSISIFDSTNNKKIDAVYYVSPDYFSVGTDDDWARLPLTPMAAQKIADTLNCFLPTRKMVDDIYKAAKVKLEPVPLFAFRDSTPIFWHHHLIIEGARKGQRGLIAGIKKDVVISGRISRDSRPDREAIYGWHRMDGKPIQPLYTGHINWWVDYSHGIRLVYEKVKVEGKWYNYKEILNHPLWRRLLCDEEWCDYYRYDY